MGGEDQLKALIRQAFSLNNTADKAVLSVDGVLAKSMTQVKKLIGLLPEEGLLRNKTWKDLEPLVKTELAQYGDQLGQAIVNANSEAAPDMRDYAVREFEHGGADLPEAVRVRNQPVPNSVALALNSKVNNVRLEKLFGIKGGESPVNKALFKTVNTRVRAGIIRGDTTKDIADLMATDVMAAGVPGVQLTAPVAKQIKSQATAIARTATQDMARQVKEQVYEQNKEATEGMVWQWSTALDSRTCETCAPLDARRWEQEEKGRPDWPIHPNCRCQSMLIDPEDDFWNGKEVTAQQIRPVEEGAYQYKGKPVTELIGADREEARRKGLYVTPITIDGKKYYRKAITVTSDTGPPRYSDVLAKWAKEKDPTSINEALGPSRADWFRTQAAKKNADPQQILQAMLTQKPAGQQTFIDLEKLQKKSLSFKAKPKPKLKPVAKAKPAPKPKPKPKVPSPQLVNDGGKAFKEAQAAKAEADRLKKELAAAKKAAAKAKAQKALEKAKETLSIPDSELNRALDAAAKPLVRKARAAVAVEKAGVDPDKLFDASDKVLGRSAFGTAKLTPQGVAKRGFFTPNETKALNALEGTGITPKLLGESWIEAKATKGTFSVPTRKGTILMSKVEGRTISSQLTQLTDKDKLDAFDGLLRSRSKIHRAGVAHNDMHSHNLMWDKSKKQMGVIDLGLARVDERAALVEALGTMRGRRTSFGEMVEPGDYQSRSIFKALNPKGASTNKSAVWKRFNANRKKVEAEIAKDGLADEFKDASIKALPRGISKGMTKARAQELIDMLYEGIE